MLASALAGASSAIADGTYEVVSCAAAGGQNHAWSAFNDDPNAARMWLAGVTLVCFYAAWSLLRQP